MITVKTPLISVIIADVVSAGEALTAPQAEALNSLWAQRISSAARSVDEVPDLILSYEFSLKLPEEYTDALTFEARRIAKALLVAAAARQGIRLSPESLATHIGELARSSRVLERAERELNTKREIALRALGGGACRND